LQRYSKNPILIADQYNWWESKAVFNPAILYDGNKVHMLYRAIGEREKYISRIGYAYSKDGLNFERQREIAISPLEDYEKYGMEDPRLVQIDDQIYITYVVLSDYVSMGPTASTALAMTTDFKKYIRLGIITSKGSDNKDVVLFPEKINGKYLFLHRPTGWVGQKFGIDKPSIWLGEGSSLTSFEKHTILLKPKYDWEDSKIGSGPPPIKTRKGWLLIYHGVDKNLIYRAGAALLDLSNPSVVIGRTEMPILEPEEQFEKIGHVKNVVFPTGSCIIDDILYLYYGAADKVCCVATFILERLLEKIV
jgi:beta-1,2-mannobiose phosphorylase / 1,2-beta-oligomannan phosphorylase